MPSLGAMATIKLDKPRGARLKAAREAIGKTQKEIAVIVGRDAITVSRWERGAPVPDEAMTVLARTYGTTAERLAGRTALRVVEPTEDAGPPLDAKEQVRRTDAYRDASDLVRYWFDHDPETDRRTSSAKAKDLSVEIYMVRLAEIRRTARDGLLPPIPTEPMGGAVFEPEPDDPDAPQKR